MPTLVVMPYSGPKSEDTQAEPGLSSMLLLLEDFDRVMDAVIPMNQPSSALEARERLTFHRLDGERIFIRPEQIVQVEEVTSRED